MSRALRGRLQKLEARPTGPREIRIYCDDEADVPRVVEEMIAAGKLTGADRPFCVHWLKAKGPSPFTHEDVLEQLDKANEPRD